MEMYNDFYMDLLGRIGDGKLRLQGLGMHHVNGHLQRFEEVVIPIPIGPPPQECTIL